MKDLPKIDKDKFRISLWIEVDGKDYGIYVVGDREKIKDDIFDETILQTVQYISRTLVSDYNKNIKN